MAPEIVNHSQGGPAVQDPVERMASDQTSASRDHDAPHRSLSTLMCPAVYKSVSPPVKTRLRQAILAILGATPLGLT